MTTGERERCKVEGGKLWVRSMGVDADNFLDKLLRIGILSSFRIFEGPLGGGKVIGERW